MKVEKEKRKDGFNISSFDRISDKTCDPLTLPLWQAEPLEHAIPFKSSWNNNNDAFSGGIGNKTFSNVYVLKSSSPQQPFSLASGISFNKVSLK